MLHRTEATVAVKIQIVLEKVDEVDCCEDFMTFLNLVKNNKFPHDNMAMLLFFDIVRFYGTTCTTQIKYRPQTKAFWKAGRNLSNNKFLFFMGGPKNIGQQIGSGSSSTFLQSENASINFAVPSVPWKTNAKYENYIANSTYYVIGNVKAFQK